MYKGNYSVEVLVNGHEAREYSHKGNIYIEGREGTAYRIKVKNNGCSRVKAVVSVDGINVISGDEASLDGRGYIISGYSSMVIEGWRRDHNNVHEFFFSDVGKSYSVKSGKGDKNVGVIGVSIIEENVSQCWNWGTITSGNSYHPNHSVGSSMYYVQCGSNDTTSYSLSCRDVTNTCSNNTIGTGWGKEINSNVTEVSFNGKNYPAETFEIFYDTKRGLEKKGVRLDKCPHYIDGPQAFPGSFCQPPRN